MRECDANKFQLSIYGCPPLGVSIPAGWRYQIAPPGSLILHSPTLGVFVMLVLAERTDTKTLDEVAIDIFTEISALPPRPTGPRVISGYHGNGYAAWHASDGGYFLDVQETLIELRNSHLASIMLITRDSATATERAEGRTAVESVPIADA